LLRSAPCYCDGKNWLPGETRLLQYIGRASASQDCHNGIHFLNHERPDVLEHTIQGPEDDTEAILEPWSE
jgi:hypothetical protein